MAKKTVDEIENILPEPIVIEVENVGPATRTNIRLFGGVRFDPSWVTPFPGVTVRSGLSNMTYSQDVENTKSKPLQIGMIGYSSNANNPAIFQPTIANSLSFGKFTMTGSTSASTMVLRDDPYSRKATVYSPVKFQIDNESTIILRTVRAGETITLYLFPAIPEMKKVRYPDVERGVITLSGAMFASGDIPSVNLGNKNYMLYRLAGGIFIVAGVCGLLYSMGMDFKKK